MAEGEEPEDINEAYGRQLVCNTAIKELKNHGFRTTKNWHQLGGFLGVSLEDRRRLATQAHITGNYEIALEECLDIWIMNDREASWNKLIRAVERYEKDTAKRLRHNLMGVRDKAKEVFPEATDEHKEENTEIVEILLEEVESCQEIVISKDSEINELKSELQKQKDKIEQLKSKLTSEKKKSKKVDIQSDITTGLKIELQKQKDIKSQENFKKKANCVKRSALKEKYGQDIGRFRETTGNIAAIDIGTTFCSLAYTTGSEEQSVANIKLNDFYYQVPTAVLLCQKQYRLPDDSDDPLPKSMVYEVKAFGYQAQEEHRKLHNHDRSKCLYFELNLQQDKDVNRNMAIKASNGTECYIVEVIAFILCYLKKELQKHLPLTRNVSTLTTDDFDWVIIVPAIWKSRGKLMMREAAYKAGLCSNENTIDRFIKVGRGVPRPKENNPDRLSLVLKSDAEAIFCQTMRLQDVQQHCNVSGSLRSNRYVVIDIGGGTIDHRYQDGTHIEVISEWVGSNSGGMKVNNEFSKLLQKIFQDESSDPNDTIGFPRYLQSDDPSTLALRHDVINFLLHKEFEFQKVSFGINAKGTEPLSQPDEQAEADKEVCIKLPFKMVDFYGLDKIEEGVEALQDDRIQP